jgi:hypothetical protein
MSDEPKDKQVVPIDDHYDDGFSDFEPSERTIQGSFLKFTQEGKWTEVGITVPSGLKLLAAETASILQRWKDQKVVDTISQRPFPDIDTLNEAIPKEEWEIDLNGQPRPPYQHTSILYLLNPTTMEKFTYATSTVGGRIAVSELKDSVVFMRRYRGESTLAVVELSSKPMRTRFGERPRPFFRILEWRASSGGTAALPVALPKQLAAAPAVTAPLPGNKVEAPTLQEQLNDSLPF